MISTIISTLEKIGRGTFSNTDTFIYISLILPYTRKYVIDHFSKLFTKPSQNSYRLSLLAEIYNLTNLNIYRLSIGFMKKKSTSRYSVQLKEISEGRSGVSLRIFVSQTPVQGLSCTWPIYLALGYYDVGMTFKSAFIAISSTYTNALLPSHQVLNNLETRLNTQSSLNMNLMK